MRLSKITAVFAATLMAFSLAGCAGSSGSGSNHEEQIQSESINAEAIAIDDAGFNANASGLVTYAFTCTNPNDGYVAKDVVFSIEGFDVAGNRVLGSTATVQSIFPGVPTAVAGSSQLVSTTTLDRIEVSPSMELIQWIPTEATSEDVDNMFAVVNSRNARNSDGNVEVEGTVVANNEEQIATCEGVSTDAIQAAVTVLLMDSEGQLIGGSDASILNLTQDEGVIHATENLGTTDSANTAAEDASAKGEVLKGANFSMSIKDIPGYSECRIYVLPVLG